MELNMIKVFWGEPEETAECLNVTASDFKSAQENSLKVAGKTLSKPPAKPTPPPIRKVAPL